ncbi:glycosyltransferase [Cupriavidus plantarum]|uniref:glycosyltransferase n=1 Tax=Cupriavidus plantarum TaxID=942865 RepID=UPI00339D5E91
MIGVVVPIHNEEADLEACLHALREASLHPALNGEPVTIVTVLDACGDGSAQIVERHMGPWLACLTIDARNVGVARHTGAEYLIAAGARWLAFTDADSRVAPDWLVSQLAERADAVCGLVTVDDWSHHPSSVARRFTAHYQRRRDHRHIHGANFGLTAEAYTRAGGFPAIATSEDVALVERLQAIDAHIAWSAAPEVVTSSRATGRCRGGFADFLCRLRDEAVESVPVMGGLIDRPDI